MCNCPNQGLGFGSGCQSCRPSTDWIFHKGPPRQAPHLFGSQNVSSGGRIIGDGSVSASSGSIFGDVARQTGGLLGSSNTLPGRPHIGYFGHGQCSSGSGLPSSGNNSDNDNNSNNKPTFGSAQTTGGVYGNIRAPGPSGGRPFSGANNANRPDFVPTEPTGRQFGHAQASSQPSKSHIFGYRATKANSIIGSGTSSQSGSELFGASNDQGQQQPQQVFNTYNIEWKYYDYSNNAGPHQTKR